MNDYMDIEIERIHDLILYKRYIINTQWAGVRIEWNGLRAGTSSVVVVVDNERATTFPLTVQPLALVHAMVVRVAVLGNAVVLINRAPRLKALWITLFVFLL